MKVKICGITTMETARVAVDAGADFLGFVFADSRRKISPIDAKQIADQVPREVKKVGVFVNESPETINEICQFVGLDFIQLHGDETPEIASSLNRPIIKAWSIQDKINPTTFPCDYYLIDSPKGAYRGGNGIAFDWTLLHHLPIQKEKLILAGGLNVENVAAAIQSVHPAIIDVSSGVETNGQKDPIKINAFIKTAKQAVQTLKESVKK
ncbi:MULTISPECIES: phosphoribosylanthranilate isomerase [Heyndrickxia]|uniref:N-(5'-phosphoribosyl)anthranilate isomerase n=1 Tax=Heyndrickxia sporothermodurans TaxID=46224 RepID=A0A150LI12_9BACI|nr:phosphoribosylanthranilate isomerase [Heyndrickxia sporothermodurans]KYD11372.1 Phosphoribosylanthranilate isomerase [Heyndrickxia sporothermodurans]PTY79139.1 N-(5'-phosphoribosyl)anthranilate isomerase [Heyndrickxia sporothermodurans]